LPSKQSGLDFKPQYYKKKKLRKNRNRQVNNFKFIKNIYIKTTVNITFHGEKLKVLLLN
jgi:hypothetical protein